MGWHRIEWDGTPHSGKKTLWQGLNFLSSPFILALHPSGHQHWPNWCLCMMTVVCWWGRLSTSKKLQQTALTGVRFKVGHWHPVNTGDDYYKRERERELLFCLSICLFVCSFVDTVFSGWNCLSLHLPTKIPTLFSAPVLVPYLLFSSLFAVFLAYRQQQPHFAQVPSSSSSSSSLLLLSLLGRTRRRSFCSAMAKKRWRQLRRRWWWWWISPFPSTAIFFNFIFIFYLFLCVQQQQARIPSFLLIFFTLAWQSDRHANNNKKCCFMSETLLEWAQESAPSIGVITGNAS